MQSKISLATVMSSQTMAKKIESTSRPLARGLLYTSVALHTVLVLFGDAYLH